MHIYSPLGGQIKQAFEAVWKIRGIRKESNARSNAVFGGMLAAMATTGPIGAIAAGLGFGSVYYHEKGQMDILLKTIPLLLEAFCLERFGFEISTHDGTSMTLRQTIYRSR